MHLRNTFFIAAIAVFATTSAVFSAPWTVNASGQNSRFSWSAVHSSNPGLLGHTTETAMGSPDVSPLGLFFQGSHASDPMDFVVDVNDTQVDTDERWVMSTVPAAPVAAGNALNLNGSNPPGAAPFDSIRVVETGTYVSNNPLADFSRNQSIAITIFDPFTFTFPFAMLDLAFYPNGTWVATAEIDLLAPTFGAGVKTMQVDLINILALTQSGISANASITKTSSYIYVPEPSTVILSLVALPMIFVRRRRSL
ncbi:MAG: PEP-CTERM sorting domain-containing protein [Phycisphaerales bacterium]|nr:PEP-CTERM sorting domain-containing protein [Phycisphaerales bacterium]MCB9854289.1 PEP-CTERM sorting domain-containing protein [Phycisphaerales bacterium]MCB9863490.1 PEP-CTERM sorting domain-containing protein [Phycisphaerales bacterium]